MIASVSIEVEENYVIKNFNDCKLLVTDLQQHIIRAEKNLNNADLFNIWNSPEKALQDLRRESGSFVWTHTFRAGFPKLFQAGAPYPINTCELSFRSENNNIINKICI